MAKSRALYIRVMGEDQKQRWINIGRIRFGKNGQDIQIDEDKLRKAVGFGTEPDGSDLKPVTVRYTSAEVYERIDEGDGFRLIEVK